MRDSRNEAVLIATLDERGEDCAAKLRKTWEGIDSARETADKANKANGY